MRPNFPSAKSPHCGRGRRRTSDDPNTVRKVTGSFHSALKSAFVRRRSDLNTCRQRPPTSDRCKGATLRRLQPVLGCQLRPFRLAKVWQAPTPNAHLVKLQYLIRLCSILAVHVGRAAVLSVGAYLRGPPHVEQPLVSTRPQVPFLAFDCDRIRFLRARVPSYQA